ncbi:unnamed protein product, partial [Porites lobata]
MTDKHDNNRDIDLKDTGNVINSKQQTFNEMTTNRETLVCYKDVRDVFISLKESVFPMETHLDMGNSYIYNVKSPINNYQETSKGNVDGKLDKNVNTSVVQNNIQKVMRQVLYKADKRDFESYIKRDGSLNMTGNLQLNNSRIKGLPTTTPQSGDEAILKD